MDIFLHHLYEYRKGLRNLILHTVHVSLKDKIIEILQQQHIAYLVFPVTASKFNIFFGNDQCIAVLKEIGKSDLTDFTDEEDFILGIMLGYDRLKQCERYLKRKRLRHSTVSKARPHEVRQTFTTRSLPASGGPLAGAAVAPSRDTSCGTGIP